MSPTARRVLIGLAGAAWVASVVVAYYAVHKPISSVQAQALGRLALMLVAWIGTLCLAHWLGGWAGAAFQTFAPREGFTLRVGLGLGTLGVIMLALGAVHGYRGWLAWGLMLCTLPLSLRPILVDLRAVIPRLPRDNASRALALFSLAILGMAFVRALAPPTAWDALVYHLTGPKLYVQAGGLHHALDLPYLGFPQWGSMLFTWGLLLAGPELAQLFHFTFAILSLMLLPGLARRIGLRRSWLAAAMMLAVPTAALLAGWAYVEWMTMFAGLAAVVLLTSSLPLLAGAFAGLALDAKYTAIGLALGLATLALVRLRVSRAFGKFLIGGALAVSPFLAKNLVLTGNPVYPFFLPGVFWDAHRAFWYSRPGTGLDGLQLLLAPWEATTWGIEGAEALGHPPYSATLGPLMLALIPLGLARAFFPERGSRMDQRMSGADLCIRPWELAVVCAVAYMVWLVEMAFSGLLVQTRLLMPILPLLATLAAVGFEAFRAVNVKGFSAQFVVGGLVALTLAISAVESVVAFVSESPVSAIVGVESQGDYLSKRLGQYRQAVDRVNELAPGSRVVFLWEPRSYYCAAHVVCEPDALLDRWWHLRQHGGDAASIADAWRSSGVTHLLIFQAGADVVRAEGFDPLTPDDWSELERLESNSLEPIAAPEGGYALYRLKER